MKLALLQNHHPGGLLVLLLALGTLVVYVNGYSSSESREKSEESKSSSDDEDDDDQGGYVDDDDFEEVSEEFQHNFYSNCDPSDKYSECKGPSATVQNIDEEIEDAYGEECKGEECKKDMSHYDTKRTEEDIKIAAMSYKDIQKDNEDYIWAHEKYEDDPEGCGFPICVLIDAKPRRFRSLCQFMRFIKEESLEHRIFHFQKGDCITAIKGGGKNYEWGKKAEKCDLEKKFDIPLCLVDFEKKGAIHFDNPCLAMQYMSYRKNAMTMYLMTGDKKTKDLCEYLKDKNTKIKTEWFDIDDPCILGDAESAVQVYHYTTTYKKSAEWRFCNKNHLFSETTSSPLVQTIHGQSLNDANEEGQITQITRANGGEFLCLNSRQDKDKKPGKPDYWFTRTVLCKDYRIQFKCKCFFGCRRKRKENYKEYGLELGTKWHVRSPKHKTLFDECEWHGYVSISSDDTWDTEVRHKMLWGRKKGGDSNEGDYKLYKGHACGDGIYDAMYIDVRRIKDSKPASETGERITKETPQFGFLCFDKNQDGDKTCSNYKVRFCCAPPKMAEWGQWTKWTDCSVTCGGGSRERQRICDQNSPDRTCANVTPDMEKNKEGKPIEVHKSCPCNDIPCNKKSYCKWTDWSEWSQCTVTCGEGTRTKERRGNKDCDKKIPIPGTEREICPGSDEPCPDRNKSPEKYKKTDKCKDQECSDPIWATWGEWAKCSSTCGKGTKIRQRICKDNMSGEKLDINKCKESTGGEDISMEFCDTGSCPIDWCWEAWTPWSDCSVYCGDGGFEHRQRTCQDGQFGGEKCPEEKKVEKRECGVKAKCPENCVWSSWGEWEKCSRTCFDRVIEGMIPDKEGMRCRYRKIMKEAKYGGLECKGHQDHKCENCRTEDKCPHPCKWEEWGQWEVFSTRCFDTKIEKEECTEDDYYKERIRPKVHGSHEMPCKDHKGRESRGMRPDKEVIKLGCDYPICGAEACMWTQWGDWGDCKGPCGARGTMTKRRKCYFSENGESPKDSPEEDCSVNCQWWIDKQKKLGIKLLEEMTMSCPNLCPHVGWTQWSEWGACSVQCGEGIKQRFRQCNRAGTDEIDAKEKFAPGSHFCPSESGSRREKEEGVCQKPPCKPVPECRHANKNCEEEKAKYLK